MVPDARRSKAIGSSVRREDAEVALDRLFDGHYERLVRSLTVAAGDREVARDAIQEAFVQAHLRWRRIASYDDPVGWIRRVAFNRILNHHRATRRHARALRQLGAGATSTPTEEAPMADHIDLHTALEELTVRQRVAVALHYLEGLPVDGTAEVMGLSPGSVKTHLSRARETLRGILEVPG